MEHSSFIGLILAVVLKRILTDRHLWGTYVIWKSRKNWVLLKLVAAFSVTSHCCDTACRSISLIINRCYDRILMRVEIGIIFDERLRLRRRKITFWISSTSHRLISIQLDVEIWLDFLGLLENHFLELWCTFGNRVARPLLHRLHYHAKKARVEFVSVILLNSS